MARAKLYETILDAEGDIIVGATVTVRQPGTSTAIVETMYAADTGGTTLTNPLTSTSDGSITFYLDAGRRVDLFVQATGYADKTLGYVPVLDDPADIETHTHAATAATVADPPTGNTQITAASLAKGWAVIDTTGTVTSLADYNVSGVTDGGTGNFGVTWDRDFTSGNYAWSWGLQDSTCGVVTGGTVAAGSLSFFVLDLSAALLEPDVVTIIAHGTLT